jgi:hypothetical protein
MEFSDHERAGIRSVSGTASRCGLKDTAGWNANGLDQANSAPVIAWRRSLFRAAKNLLGNPHPGVSGPRGVRATHRKLLGDARVSED